MSEYGLKIKNSSGGIIIDGQYKNFAKWAADTTVLTSYINTIAFSATNQMPLIALKPEINKEIILWGLRKTGSNYDGFYVQGLNGNSLDWIIYAAHPGSSGEGYGLKTYNPSGILIFDAGYQYFNIYQAITGISLSTPEGADEAVGTYYDVNHPDIEDPYYFISPLGFWTFGISSGTQFRMVWRIGIKKLSTTSVRVKWCHKFTGPSGGSDYNEGWNPNLNLMVLK